MSASLVFEELGNVGTQYSVRCDLCPDSWITVKRVRKPNGHWTDWRMINLALMPPTGCMVTAMENFRAWAHKYRLLSAEDLATLDTEIYQSQCGHA
jgi:hypothetical protein